MKKFLVTPYLVPLRTHVKLPSPGLITDSQIHSLCYTMVDADSLSLPEPQRKYMPPLSGKPPEP